MRERAWSPSLPTARASVATRYPGSWWAGAAKLPVSQPEDSLEREADQFADLIMRTAGPSPQHQPASPGAPGLSDLAGRGQPLPNDVRSFFEPRFGHDFSSVRIHSDQRAADLAAEHDARAFTVKRDIVFGPGEYQPTTPAGRHLLAHELTHVVQQADSVGLQRQAIESSQASESELEIEGDREIDQVVGAFPLANRGSRLHGPPVAQRVCAKSVAEVGYPVRIDLHIPATPSPNRSQTTAQISAMANDDSGQTAGLTRFNARLVWAVGVGSRGGRSWITRIRVFFRNPSIRIFLTREFARGSCEAEDLERHERRHDDDFRANVAEAERTICDTAGTWPRSGGSAPPITQAQLLGLVDDWMAFEDWQLQYDNWLDGCTWDTVDYPRLYTGCAGVNVLNPQADCADAPARPEPQHVIPLPNKP